MEKDPAQAVGHIPSGLFIVSTKSPDGPIDGFLASWIQQVSFSPLLISMAIKPGRPAYDTIHAGNPFTINITGEHDRSALQHFWKGYDPKNNPFDQLAYLETSEGGILLKSAKSSLICKLKEVIRPGDHDLIIAEVITTYTLENKTKSLIHLRKSGKDY